MENKDIYPSPYQWIAWGQQISLRDANKETFAILNWTANRENWLPPAKERNTAKLLAAAPELLEALESLINANSLHEGYHEKKLQAIQAIKKATE